MARDTSSVVRELCLGFPETEEVMSHGSPNFRVAGKTFATYSINHHGDGRVALWLRSPAGAQQFYTEMEADAFFIPPYVGPKGWLGMELNKGLSWSTIASRVREAYQEVAPSRLSSELPDTISITPPDQELSPEQIDPFLRPRAQTLLTALETRVSSLPETAPATQFGSPVWKAGKKTFVSGGYVKDRLCLQFWVGSEQQSMLTYDKRYTVPAYMGHNGWINLDVEDSEDWREIENLLLHSYRHFALKRMLKALPENPALDD